jgi:purine nucleosidase/pyrimidine-specific ribonucleoside hydrolase
MTGSDQVSLTPVIIDTDPGVDDAVALLMALSCPQFVIRGFTTTAGNVPLARATRNTLALLQFLGRADPPVFRGAARPMRGRFAYARHIHSPSGLTRRLPEPKTAPAGAGAVRFLADTLNASPGRVTVIALGPLTNLARLRRDHPSAFWNIGRLVVMGGAVEAPGNATAHAEFNFFSDPTAAKRVIESGLPLTLVDLAVCRKVYVTRSEAGGLSSQSRAGKLAAELLGGWFAKDDQRERFNLYDPLAVATAVNPGVLKTREVTLAVDDSETDDDSTLWGRCRIVDQERGPVSIGDAGAVDGHLARQIINELLGWRRSATFVSSPRS